MDLQKQKKKKKKILPEKNKDILFFFLVPYLLFIVSIHISYFKWILALFHPSSSSSLDQREESKKRIMNEYCTHTHTHEKNKTKNTVRWIDGWMLE